MSEYDEHEVDYDDSGERTASELENIHSILQDILTVLREINAGSGALSALWVVAVILALFSWPGSRVDRFTDRLWYSVGCGAEWKNVDIERRPTECDFLHSPLGTKKCSYKNSKYIFGETERQALIQQAQTQEEKTEISKKPNSAIVYWEKKDEP
jgi:phage baseplate assembly protein W